VLAQYGDESESGASGCEGVEAGRVRIRQLMSPGSSNGRHAKKITAQSGAISMPTPVRTQRRLDFVDTDMAGHRHFSNFFRFMESAEIEVFAVRCKCGSMRTPEGQRIGFPRVWSGGVRLPAAGPVPDVIDIIVRVDKVGAKSVTYRFDFEKPGQLSSPKGISSPSACKTAGDQFNPSRFPPEVRSKDGIATGKRRSGGR